MSTLRFKVGDLARLLPTACINPGAIVEIYGIGPFPDNHIDPRDGRPIRAADYLIHVPNGRLGPFMACDDDQLEPLNPPKEDDADRTDTVDPAWQKLKDQLQITADLAKEKRREKA